VYELNLSLSEITKNSGESSFSADAFDSALDGCIVVYFNKTPVGCGVFKHRSSEVCELKRMFSKQPSAGAFILRELEKYAVEKGYRRAVLSTRRINHKAIKFYERNHYSESKPYGRYIGVQKSVCLSKELCT